MKKFLAALLALSMFASMSSVALADGTEGEIYEKDDDGYISDPVSGDLIPGKTYYVYICDDNEDPASKAYIKYECISFETDKKFSLLSSSLPIVKRKMSSATRDYGYFAEMKLKEIPTSSYSDDGYSLEFKKFEEKDYHGGPVPGIDGDTFNVAYPEGSDITDDLQFFELDDTTETYCVDGSDVEVLIDSTGVRTKALIRCNTEYDDTIGNKYYNTNMDFYYFNGARLRRQATVTIPIDNGMRYLYEITSSGLKEIMRKDNTKFEFRTATLGKYILCDKQLPTSGTAATPEVPVTPEVPAYTPTPEPIPSTLPNLPGAPSGGYIPYNPGTGAIA